MKSTTINRSQPITSLVLGELLFKFNVGSSQIPLNKIIFFIRQIVCFSEYSKKNTSNSLS